MNPSPTIVFKVNLETVQRYSWDQPNRTNLVGNETVAEADNMKNTRSIWIPGLLNTNLEGIGGESSGGQTPYLKHGSQFTMYGQQALYLKSLYVSNPASPSDLLIVVSQQ